MPPPLTMAQLARTLREYRPAITLAVLGATAVYVILAVALYLLAPAVRVTSLRFRVDFTGAEKGEYPNGTRFSSADIISTPVLAKTFRENDLQRFTNVADFVSSTFVVESNEAREALAREYQARLMDVRLSAVDREQLQREYESKASSLAKNELSINYAPRNRGALPDTLAKKVLHDILRNWVDYVTAEQHVLEYRVRVLSPDVVAPPVAGGANPIVTAVVLRGGVTRLLQNIERLRELPNAELIRGSDGTSLEDVSVRLDDLLRYGLDPLIQSVAAARLDNRPETLRFLGTQLAHDEQALQAGINTADALQRTLSLYVSAPAQREVALSARPAAAATTNGTAADAETLMPQLSDSFLDRLMQLANQSADAEFRQRIARDFEKASLEIVPSQQAVDYDRSILETVRNAGGGEAANAPAITAELQKARADVRQASVRVQEFYKLLSRNLNASTELVVPGTPRTRVERAIPLQRLIIGGMLIAFIALVISLVWALLHSRMRSEDRDSSTAAAHAPVLES